MKKRDFYLYLFIVLFTTNFFAQTQITIQGTLINTNNERLEKANIILKDIKTLAILNYSTSNSEGFFKLSVKSSENKFKLIISCLGYETLERFVEITSSGAIDLGNIELINNTTELKELVLESQKKAIITKGDTTIYNISRFLNGTEDNLKDLIKNLPGMRINANGKIEVNGVVISELLIDGDNLYKNQHQLATENLSSKIVKSIEFYKNYTPFDRIKTDSLTNNTALNVIIKDEYKKKMKGHLLTESNFNDRFKVNSALYNINKKNKFSVIQNWNNLGDLPISIIDYFTLIENDESEINDGSSVNFKSLEFVPKFLKSGENVAQKNNSFFNISNIYTPNKKVKLHFYSILNDASQNEIFENSQIFTDSDLNVTEKNKIHEKSLFGIFSLKSIYKPNDETVFKINNYALIDNVNERNNIESIINNNASLIKQFNDNKARKFENNFIFSKKIKKSLITANAFLNIEETKNENIINSNIPFLNLDFNGDYIFNQDFNKTQTDFGAESQYNIKFNKINTGLKASYKNSSYNFENNSSTHLDYTNYYKAREHFFTQEINANINPFKKISLSMGISNNTVLQNINSLDDYQTSFLGYNVNLKFTFNHNSILQINNSYSSTLSTQDNLIENEYIKDYRTIIRNLDLQPNTVFPLKKIGINYLKTNPKTNTFLIVNFNHSWTRKSENINLINEDNYSVFENAISTRNDFSDFVIFYEKNLKKLPFVLTFNTDSKYTFRKYFINENLSFFKSMYISNSFSIRSKFKKSPVHFDLGYSFSTTIYNNNNSTSKNKVRQLFTNTNGLVAKNIYWKISYSYNNFIVNNDSNLIPILSAGLRYAKQKSNWECIIDAYNLLNFDNPVFVTNQSSLGYESQVSNLNLPGYVSVGLKYKF